MNVTFNKVLISYIVITAFMFLSIGILTSNALAGTAVHHTTTSWLGDAIIFGVNLFVKAVMAFI